MLHQNVHITTTLEFTLNSNHSFTGMMENNTSSHENNTTLDTNWILHELLHISINEKVYHFLMSKKNL